MAILLCGLSLALAALLACAVGGSRARPAPRPAPRIVTPPPAEVLAAPALRPSPRTAVHTSAALLAIALALDVSSPAQALAASAEPDAVYAAAVAADIYVLPQAEAQAWSLVELAPDWAFKAVSATDGWLI